VSFVVNALFPISSVHEALDTVLQVDNIEVYKQSERFATEFEVRKDLSLMDRSDGLDRLNLYYH
jgi:hypothetical protein